MNILHYMLCDEMERTIWKEYRYGLSIESDGVHDISFARIAVNSYGLVVIGYVGAIQGWVDLDCSGVEVRELIRESDIPWSVRIDLFGIRLGVVFYDLECRDRLEGERESIFGGQGTFGRWNLIEILGLAAMSELDWPLMKVLTLGPMVTVTVESAGSSLVDFMATQ